jgi:hypothetical protein
VKKDPDRCAGTVIAMIAQSDTDTEASFDE